MGFSLQHYHSSNNILLSIFLQFALLKFCRCNSNSNFYDGFIKKNPYIELTLTEVNKEELLIDSFDQSFGDAKDILLRVLIFIGQSGYTKF